MRFGNMLTKMGWKNQGGDQAHIQKKCQPPSLRPHGLWVQLWIPRYQVAGREQGVEGEEHPEGSRFPV